MNGAYKIPTGAGVIGGAMIVKFEGFDGVSGDLAGEVVASGAALFVV